MFFKHDIKPDDIFNLSNIGYKHFITSFNALSTEDKIAKIDELIENDKLSFLIKCSLNHPLIYNICKMERFDAIWEKNWSSMGVIFTGNSDTAFYKESGLHPFTRVRGAFLFLAATDKKNFGHKKDLSYNDRLINYAIADNSIHALQYYVKYWYKKMDSGTLSYTDIDSQLKLILSYIKKQLPFYRSYAFLMLAEGFIRYGINQSAMELPKKNIDQSFKAAIKSCREAQRHFSSDNLIIFNASKGTSIAASNTMNLDDFDQIIKYIEDKYIQNYSDNNCESHNSWKS